MTERVTVSIEGGVADVRLNRPDKINALDQAMFAGIVEAGERLKTERGVRAVVLSGEGRGFCSGLDFGSFQAMAGGGERSPRSERPERSAASREAPLGAIGETEGRITHQAQQSAHVWQEIEVPVIAAVHGVAYGGGCQIALGADLRIAAPDARFSIMEIRWGLVPDMTGTATLTRLVGLDVAKELTFTGRVVSGEEAVRLGLATRTSASPHEEAMALAREIAGKNPAAVRAAKRLLNDSPGRPLAEQFAAERAAIGRLIGSKNQREAVMSEFEKRPAVFED